MVLLLLLLLRGGSPLPPLLDAVVLLRPLVILWHKRPHFAPPLLQGTPAARGANFLLKCCYEGG